MSPRVVRRKAKVVVVRVDGEMHAVLAAAAKRAEMPVARLARVLLTFGLAKLERGNAEIQRAVKTSRDAVPQRAVRISRNG